MSRACVYCGAMAKTNGKKRGRKAVGVVGLLTTMGAVFWFALRPRLQNKKK